MTNEYQIKPKKVLNNIYNKLTIYDTYSVFGNGEHFVTYNLISEDNTSLVINNKFNQLTSKKDIIDYIMLDLDLEF